jgi:microcystin-dependent protein
MVGFNFAPRNWAFCNGQLLAIQQNQALFSILGTTYGGDGVRTFGLPDLRSRVPVHQGTAFSGTQYPLGQLGGTEAVTLGSTQLPSHTHPVTASKNPAGQASPASNLWAFEGRNAYSTNPGAALALAAVTTTPAGSTQPHDNRSPFLVVNFIIAIIGIFPSRN